MTLCYGSPRKSYRGKPYRSRTWQSSARKSGGMTGMFTLYIVVLVSQVLEYVKTSTGHFKYAVYWMSLTLQWRWLKKKPPPLGRVQLSWSCFWCTHRRNKHNYPVKHPVSSSVLRGTCGTHPFPNAPGQVPASTVGLKYSRIRIKQVILLHKMSSNKTNL